MKTEDKAKMLFDRFCQPCCRAHPCCLSAGCCIMLRLCCLQLWCNVHENEDTILNAVHTNMFCCLYQTCTNMIKHVQSIPVGDGRRYLDRIHHCLVMILASWFVWYSWTTLQFEATWFSWSDRSRFGLSRRRSWSLKYCKRILSRLYGRIVAVQHLTQRVKQINLLYVWDSSQSMLHQPISLRPCVQPPWHLEFLVRPAPPPPKQTTSKHSQLRCIQKKTKMLFSLSRIEVKTHTKRYWINPNTVIQREMLHAG